MRSISQNAFRRYAAEPTVRGRYIIIRGGAIMAAFEYILMGLLVVCAISVSFSKNLLNSILIFMSYSLVMSIIWILLESPDLAITEAAVGAGVTSVLFFVTLKKIHALGEEDEETDE